MTANNSGYFGARYMAALLVGTMLAGVGTAANAQTLPETTPPPAAAPAAPAVAPPLGGTVRSIKVRGNQRLEPDTVRSYIQLREGEPYTTETLDQALRDLFATELFQDVQILGADTGNIVIQVRENPVINRIVLEGNKRLKEDKIRPEIRLAPRQIFTRSKVRADVARIIELYRRQGRFAATVEPKMVMLDQNRVDIIFEISEGPRSKVRQINIIGNEEFSDATLRSEMATKQSRFFRFFSSSDSYDPDRLAYDQGKLRQFYLTEGYADFRVISAVAELTPDRRDFIITYVVEEGERYKFGDVNVESDIRDFNEEGLKAMLPMKKGDWYNAKQVEDTIEQLTETAGLFGYAFAEVEPNFERSREEKTMSVTFRVNETPRVYVERIDINGNTITQDKVIRREFRLQEGDAFNAFLVKRSQDRIQSLGYFQEKLEIEQKPGSAPDRIILEANVEEKPTGELQLSAGFSSLERFIVNASIRQRNFRGKGQELRASVNYSSYSKSVELGFTEPYLFDRNIAVGGDIYRQDFNSFNFIGDRRETTYEQVRTGFGLRVGVPLTEYWQIQGRYTLNFDDISLDQRVFFFDPDGTGPLPAECDPFTAGRYLCDAIGERTTSSIGYSLAYTNLDNSIRPTRGERLVLSQDFAGLGGTVKYLRTRLDADKYWNVGSGFIFSLGAEGGAIIPFEESPGPGIDAVRLTDRFFLGEPQIRGFDIRGVGPRVQRLNYLRDAEGKIILENGVPQVDETRRNVIDDALGGRYYYLARAELEIPLGSGARELGLRPSVFVDVGSVFGIERPIVTEFPDTDGDGRPDPLDRGPLIDSQGRPQFLFPDNPATTTVNEAQLTFCPIGLPDSSGVCPTSGAANAPQRRTVDPFLERFVGDSWKPRVSVGFGVNWNSPFGPFRIDIAKVLVKQDGDDTKLLTFNVGTAF